MSDKILLLNKLISNYIENKKITLTPAGMLITTINKKSVNHLTSLEIFRNELPLDVLSSGEKKIILILILSIFFDNCTLLIDEPELSMSINWQEKMLPDIINNTKLKRILVATHSPFIASDETLLDYIIPLPTEEKNYEC